MIGDWIEHTSTTGGTGALTLTALAGSPDFGDLPGWSGATRNVQYAIDEYTDATRATLAQAEVGVGTLTVSTMSLARTKIVSTWDGTTYTTASPAALTFGTTAANVRVVCAPLAGLPAFAMPWMQATVGDAIGIGSLNAQMGTGTYTGAANRETYSPFLWAGTPDVNQAAVVVTTAVASTNLRAGVYEIGSDGLPGRLIKDLTGASPFTTTATGNKTIAVTGLYLPAGWYYAGFVCNGAPVLRGATAQWPSPAGSTAGTNHFALEGTGSYATGLPATRSITLAANTTGGIALFLRARN